MDLTWGSNTLAPSSDLFLSTAHKENPGMRSILRQLAPTGGRMGLDTRGSSQSASVRFGSEHLPVLLTGSWVVFMNFQPWEFKCISETNSFIIWWKNKILFFLYFHILPRLKTSWKPGDRSFWGPNLPGRPVGVSFWTQNFNLYATAIREIWWPSWPKTNTNWHFKKSSLGDATTDQYCGKKL